jgi:vancomycin permeability regulator SanA
LKIRYNNSGFIISSTILALASFVVLSFSKYELSGMSINDYRFDYMGNILNILVTGCTIIGLVLLGFNKKPIDRKRLHFITVLLILTAVFVVTAYILTKVNIFGKNEYIFNITLKKASSGLFFILSTFSSIYIFVYIWGMILGFEKFYELRTLFRTASAVILLFIFALFYVWNVNSFSEGKLQQKKYKYGLIPGAAVYSRGRPSPIFAARIRKAFELIKKGKVEKLVLTGGNAPGEISEAEAAYKFLVRLGVKPAKLIVENETSATTEQIKFLKYDLIKESSDEDILVISDGFHLTRALEICKFFNLNAGGVSSDYDLSFEKTIFYRSRESVALLLFWFFAI